MNRLTHRDNDGKAYTKALDDMRFVEEPQYHVESNGVPHLESIVDKLQGSVVDRLAMYEDSEESGLLVQLPVTVGNTVYWIPDLSGDTIRIDKVAAICIYKNNRFRLVLPEISIEPIFPNAHLFLTIEEAEAALSKHKEAKQ